MIDSTVLIGAIIIAFTEAIKRLSATVQGVITMVVAVVVGIVVAALSSHIGLAAITVAQGILIALGSIGVHTVASAVNTKN